MRIFLIVLDSCGVGYLPDASDFGDVGSNTLLSASKAKGFSIPNMRSLGLCNIEGVELSGVEAPKGCYCRLKEASKGKDTTIGHLEIAGYISPEPLPLFENGFPDEIIDKIKKISGRDVLCNKPYSGTEVIKDYGEEHLKTGAIIVYTSADSVLQIAAHNDVVPLTELYRICAETREIMQGKYGVGRVIARPFAGEYPFVRTADRHDYALTPPTNMLDILSGAGKKVISVGKIVDIFNGKGIGSFTRTKSNEEGMAVTLNIASEDFDGLCFTNLVDFDMKYGHRRDVQGYGDALSVFDKWLPSMLDALSSDDVLMITADHGCDPAFKGTDHTREYIPLLIYGKELKRGVDLGTRDTYADISATILDFFGLDPLEGVSFKKDILK